MKESPLIPPTLNFDPDQPRDEQGRWTDTGPEMKISGPKVLHITSALKGFPKAFTRSLRVEVVPREKMIPGELAVHIPGFRIRASTELGVSRVSSTEEYESFLKKFPRGSIIQASHSDFPIDTSKEFSKEEARHILAHEVGHHVWDRLSPGQQKLAREFASKIQTKTTARYAAYIKDTEFERGDDPTLRSRVWRDKMIHEQFAEGVRQHLVEGKHKPFFKKLIRTK